MKHIQRTSCRAIFLTSVHEVLLLKIANPKSEWTGWFTPGGGMDAQETDFDCLKRELSEELGYDLQSLPPKIWTRFHSFPWGDQFFEQHEIFFLIHLENKFTLDAKTSLTENESLEIIDRRWWRLEDIAHSQENFAPSRIAQLIADLIENGVPKDPIEIGI